MCRDVTFHKKSTKLNLRKPLNGLNIFVGRGGVCLLPCYILSYLVIIYNMCGFYMVKPKYENVLK